jgi:hypothetical protein
VSRRTDIVHFFRSDPAELLGVLNDLGRDRDGWVNIQAVEAEEEAPDAPPARAGMFNFLTARGPRVPVGTWVPGAVGAKRAERDSIGIQHPAGPKANRQLLAAGVNPPEGATLLSDHPRRGLVLSLPNGTDPAVVLAWLFAASAVLAPDPLPETWVAIIHRR